MTLQERILEALGEHALKPRALYDHFLNDLPASVDFALRGLMKGGQVTFELGHYQRSTSAKPSRPTREVGHASAALNRGTEAPAGAATRPPGASPPPQSFDPRELTKREREVYDLAEQGLTRRQITERLGVSANVVSTHLSNARNKLGVKAKLGAPSRQRRSVPAPSAAVRLTAAPSREGAEAATVGVETRRCQRCRNQKPLERFRPSSLGDGSRLWTCDDCVGSGSASNERAKGEVSSVRRPTFSTDLKARLIELQRRKAEELQAACEHVSALRQELADVEEMTRIVTEGTG